MYQLLISTPCDCGLYIGTNDKLIGFATTEEEAKNWCDNFNSIHHKDSWSDYAFYREVTTTALPQLYTSEE